MARRPSTSRRITPDESLVDLLDPRPFALRHWIGLVGLVVIGIAPLVAPIVFGEIIVIRLTVALFIGMFAMSWDVVSGYTGEISFGHAFFFGLGGYTSAVLSLNLGWHPLLTITAGVVVAAIGGLLIGVPALRVSGPYLSLVTLIAPLLLLQLFTFYSGTFGGETGLRNPTALVSTIGDPLIEVDDRSTERLYNFYIAYGLFVAILGGLIAITRSNAGAIFYAIRSGEDIVSATGKNPAKFKVFVFTLSAAVGGLAGAVFVHSSVGGPTPGYILNLELSLLVIIAAVLGGMGTIVGAAIGGLFVHLLEVSVLDSLDLVVPFTSFTVSDMSFLLVGVTGLIILYVLPGGIVRGTVELGGWIRNRVRP